eukprot:m.287044 g.287044  ORF g.287044 m.287044 type:complete len:301 (-) comp27069_c1_seq2:2152-3054(-)
MANSAATAERRLQSVLRCLSSGSSVRAVISADGRQAVALVVGAGAGVGQAVALKFAKEGYHAVMVRRGGGPNRLLTEKDDSRGKLEAVAEAIRAIGGTATAMFADGTAPAAIAELVSTTERDIGPIHFVNYNVGGQIGNRSLEKTSYRAFEMAWRMGSLGAFSIAKEVSPHMAARGCGTIIFTSATAAYRGNAGQHAHAAAMAARKSLSQSIAAELNPKGIHICHVNVDATINAPETVLLMMKRFDPTFEDRFHKDLAEDKLVQPTAVASTYFHLHTQPKSTWTLDLDLRPWSTRAWFNN